MPIREKVAHRMTYESSLRLQRRPIAVKSKVSLVNKRIARLERKTKEVIASGCDLWRVQDLSRQICDAKAELRQLKAEQRYDTYT